MSARLQRVPIEARMWFGALGAPTVFTAQFVFGMGLTQWQCNAAGRGQPVDVDTWTAIATAIAAAVSVLSLVAAISAWAQTRDADEPPASRIHFMATCSISTIPLVFAIILMSGLGVLNLMECVQS